MGGQRGKHRAHARRASSFSLERLEPRCVFAANFIISEFLADNGGSLLDQDLENSDWIEIKNTGTTAGNLQGYYLTDDPTVPTQWAFPSVPLNPGEHVVVFASDKNRAISGQELHTNFKLASEGEYLGLIKPDLSVAYQFNPFPEQREDISYGTGQVTTNLTLVGAGAAAKTVVPSNSSYDTVWKNPAYTPDANWINGTTGIGFGQTFNGFQVKTYRANIAAGSPIGTTLDNMDEAFVVIANPAAQQSSAGGNFGTLNFNNNQTGGHYGSNVAYPGLTLATDVDHFTTEAHAFVTIPTAGNWTFGVSSNEGFNFVVGDFTLSRFGTGSTDVLGTFNFPTAGVYDLHLYNFERTGSSWMELYAAPGTFAAWDSVNFDLVGDVASGGLAVTSDLIGSSGSGINQLLGTNVQSQMLNQRSTFYTRIGFNVDDPAALDQLKLKMKYDDAFVATINGIEVARRNFTGATVWNETADSPRTGDEVLTYEEIDVSAFLSALTPGQNLLAIQGLNISAGDADLLVMPELIGVDIFATAAGYMDPPTPGAENGATSLGFVADTSFSADRGFYISPIDVTITTPTLGAEIRYTLDGSEPTNTHGTVYSGPVHITQTTTLRAAAFLNGYFPTDIDTQTYVFLNDVILQSPIGQTPAGWPVHGSPGTNGQQFDYGMDADIVNDPVWGPQMLSALQALPSISVVTDLDNLFDPTSGIYVNATLQGDQWERPASVEMMNPPDVANPNGTSEFQIDAGIRIRGGFSRQDGNPKHSFRLFFRNDEGGRLEYPLFGEEGADVFERVDLRTAQNYSWNLRQPSRYTFTRDVIARDLQRNLGDPYTRSRYYHLYLNGQYWGLYQTQERADDFFGETYFGGDEANYDVLKCNDADDTVYATSGTDVAWAEFHTLLQGMASGDQATRHALFMQLQGLNPDGTRNLTYPVHLDVKNVIDYMLITHIMGSRDAPLQNPGTAPKNFFAIRDRTADRGWAFFIHDFEATLEQFLLLPNGVNVNRNGPYDTGLQLNEFNPQYIHERLMFSDEYRLLFADFVRDYFWENGPMTPGQLVALQNQRAAEIATAVIAESARWGDTETGGPYTKTHWQAAVDDINNNWFPFRTGIVLDQFKNTTLVGGGSAPLFPSTEPVFFNQNGGEFQPGFHLTISGPLGGTIYYTLDGKDPREVLQAGAYNPHVAPTAQVYSGALASFTQTTVVKARALLGGVWSALEEATFTPAGAPQLKISELHYNPVEGGNVEFVEIQNLGASVQNLLNVQLAVGITYTFPSLNLNPGQRIVVVKDQAAFQTRYGAGINVAPGVFGGSLANEGERIDLLSALGQPIQSFTYDDSGDWPGRSDGVGSSLEVVDLEGDYNLASTWRASSEYGGTPGSAGQGPLNTVVVNEVLTHTDLPLVDAVELHNTTGSPINVGGWFLSDSGTNLKKFRIPNGTTIPGGGYLVYDQTQLGFALDAAHGDQVYVTQADVVTQVLQAFVDQVNFGAAANGESFGRWPNGTGPLYPMATRTLGSANSGPRIGPVIISEVMYNPSTGDPLEYIELHNVTALAVNLAGWRFTAGVDYTFGSVSLPGGGTIVVVPFDPNNTTLANQFRTAYGISAGVPLLGPWAGTLDNGGETIRLSRPDTPPPDDPGFTPYIMMDEVDYDDDPPWPAEPDGTGPSLHRLGALLGNDVASWQSSVATPGSVNFTPPQVTEVTVRGIGWSSSYLAELALAGLGDSTTGYRIPGGAAQLNPLSWTNLQQISIRFSEAVTVGMGDLEIAGVRVPEYTPTGFSYNPATFTATWTLPVVIGADKLILQLSDSVVDTGAQQLDGEWTTGADSYPSGNGAAGGHFLFRLNVVPGDLNGSGATDSADATLARFAQFAQPGMGSYQARYDLDGSGAAIDGTDNVLVRSNLFKEINTLGEPTPPGPLGAVAPVTTGPVSVPLSTQASAPIVTSQPTMVVSAKLDDLATARLASALTRVSTLNLSSIQIPPLATIKTTSRDAAFDNWLQTKDKLELAHAKVLGPRSQPEMTTAVQQTEQKVLEELFAGWSERDWSGVSSSISAKSQAIRRRS